MRINEDYLEDDIFKDEISLELVTIDDAENANFRVFRFGIKGLPNDKELDYYLKSLSLFKSKFSAALDLIPLVLDFDLNFPFRAGFIREEELDNPNIRTNGYGATILYDDERTSLINYLHKKTTHLINTIYIYLNIEPKVNTVSDVIKLMLSLYNVSNNIVKQIWGKKVRIDYIHHYSDAKYRFSAMIEQRNYKLWSELSPRSEKVVVEAFRSFNPEVKPKVVKAEFLKLLSKKADTNVDMMKEEDKVIKFVSQLNIFSAQNMKGRPRIDDKTAYVNVNGSISFRYGLENTFEKLNNFEYHIIFENVSCINVKWNIINEHPYGLTKTKTLIDFMTNFAPDCKRVSVNIENCEYLYTEFGGKTLDITEGFPKDFTIDYRILGRSDEWPRWSHYNGKHIDYDVTIVDSNSSKVQHLSNNYN